MIFLANYCSKRPQARNIGGLLSRPPGNVLSHDWSLYSNLVRPLWILVGFALLLVPRALHAEVRTSTNYAIEAETLDGGGGVSSSSNYTNLDSLEALVAGTSISSDYVILHGFISGLTIETLGNYDTWAGARGLVTGLNAGFFDDPNEDGNPNIMHFAFDTDPLGYGSSEGKRELEAFNIGGMDYLTLTIPVRTGAVFVGNPLTSNEVDGVAYEILGDGDLNDPWDLEVVEVIPALSAGRPSLGDYSPSSGGAWQYRTFRLTNPLSTSTRQYMKVGVTVSP